MEWKDNENSKRDPQKLWYPDNYLSRYNVYKFKTGIRTVKRYRHDKDNNLSDNIYELRYFRCQM